MEKHVKLFENPDETIVLSLPLSDRQVGAISIPRRHLLERLDQVVADLKHVLYGNYTPTRTIIFAELNPHQPNVEIRSRNDWWRLMYTPELSINAADELRFGYVREFVMADLSKTWGNHAHEVELALTEYVDTLLDLS